MFHVERGENNIFMGGKKRYRVMVFDDTDRHVRLCLDNDQQQQQQR